MPRRWRSPSTRWRSIASAATRTPSPATSSTWRSILKSMGDYPAALRGSRRRWRCRRLSRIRRSWPTRCTISPTSIAAWAIWRPRWPACAGPIRTSAHLLPIQRSFHLTSIAHIELQQGRVDAAIQTYRRRSSSAGVRVMPKGWRSRCVRSARSCSGSGSTKTRCPACSRPRFVRATRGSGGGGRHVDARGESA